MTKNEITVYPSSLSVPKEQVRKGFPYSSVVVRLAAIFQETDTQPRWRKRTVMYSQNEESIFF